MRGNKSAIDVMLTTEGTYPVARGGVSTWCDLLIRGVPGINYLIYAVIAHPYLHDRYTLPSGVRLMRVPMWGTEEPTEHLDVPFSTIYQRKLITTPDLIAADLLPMLEQLMQHIWNPEPDGQAAGRLLHKMYRWFQHYDYLEAMKSLGAWDYWMDGLVKKRWFDHPTPPTLADSIMTMGWLYRFLVILATPVPRLDVTHASAAAFAGLAGALAKMEHGTPYLLTEHGVWLREQYLNVGVSDMSPFAKEFMMGLVRTVSSVNYSFADVLAPVAAFNARWERRLGVPDKRIRVIYNGVDPNSFTPRPRPAGAPPTVVSVARIDPLKDIITLLRTAALVRERMPDVKFVVYGGVSVPAYYQRCLEIHRELALGDSFIFAGHVSDVPHAYSTGDISVLSSISEGFPYAVVEAMMCGRPVVCTDVGGTREACGEAGLVVSPEAPQEMADAITRLLRDADLRNALAEEGRARALAYFSLQRNFELYRTAYEDLARQAAPAKRTTLGLPDLAARRRQLALDRGRLLQAVGRADEAIREYRLAADLAPTSPATPAVLLTIAELYLAKGDLVQSMVEIERAEALAEILRNNKQVG